MSLPYSIMPAIIMQSHFMLPTWIKHISAESTLLLVLGTYPLGMFFGGYILGGISDRYGKRTVLLNSLGFSITFQLLCVFSILYNQFLLFTIARFLSGFFEGNISIARASIAHICKHEKTRKIHLGYVNVALTSGWVLGPPLGAILNKIEGYGFLMPFLCGALFTTLAFLLATLYFKEPAPINLSAKISNNEKQYKLSSAPMLLLLLMSFLIFLGVDSFYIYIPVYLASTISSSPMLIALSSTILGIFNIVSNIFLLPFLHRYLSTKATIAIFPTALCLLLFILAISTPSYKLLLLMPLIGSSIALITPNLATYLSLRLKQTKQGALMGSLLSQRTLGTVILSVLFATYAPIKLNVPFMIGSIFLISGVIMFLCISNTSQNRYSLLEEE